MLACASAYLVAVIAVRLDSIVLPGNELALPRPLRRLPGLGAATPLVRGAGPIPAVSDRITVLVLGLDRRPSEGKQPTRADSIFVLTLDPVTRTGGVLSIPRDLWVEIPDGQGGYFEDRINTAYRYGGMSGYPGGAVQAARDTVEHNFPQIRVDYAVVLDFASFVRIIDTLGGIDVAVTEEFRYPQPVSASGRNAVAPVFKSGLEHMTGDRALYYARFRDDPDGDLGRIRRQQQVMLAVANKLAGLDGVTRGADLWRQYRDAVETDIPSYRFPGVALLARQVGLERLTLRSLGDVTREVITAGGADVLVADPGDTARVVGELFYDARLRREDAAVEVQNATSRTGLAWATAADLIRRGLRPDQVRVASNVPPRREETVILNYRGKDHTAERLADWLGVPRARIRQLPDTRIMPGGPDIVVILGRDARAPSPAFGALAR